MPNRRGKSFIGATAIWFNEDTSLVTANYWPQAQRLTRAAGPRSLHLASSISNCSSAPARVFQGRASLNRRYSIHKAHANPKATISHSKSRAAKRNMAVNLTFRGLRGRSVVNRQCLAVCHKHCETGRRFFSSLNTLSCTSTEVDPNNWALA